MSSRTLKDVLLECTRAGMWSNDTVVSVNQRNIFGLTPLHLACIWGDLDAVEVLVRSGADINARGERGQTPLFAAKDIELVKLLVSLGAKKDIIDDEGYTAESYARILGRQSIASFLKSNQNDLT